MIENMMELDKLKEECGVIGIYAPGLKNISQLAYFGLHALQHRGQESAGIAANDGGRIQYYKRQDWFKRYLQMRSSEGFREILQSGMSAIRLREMLVWLMRSHWWCSIRAAELRWRITAITINAPEIREQLQDQGAIFQTSIDSEVINLVARYSTTCPQKKRSEKRWSKFKALMQLYSLWDRSSSE